MPSLLRASISDCRKLFPPLTELEDQSEWHKRHNRYLHGWGVVCGLKVNCDADRRFVQVSKGYALACDGTDIQQKEATRQNVVEAAKARKLLDANGSGKVELLIDKLPGVSAPSFDLRAHVEPANKTVLQQILAGTLAQDVIDDCIRPVLDFLRKQLFDEAANETRLVGASARRRISALNLLVQLANKSSGSNVFLSRAE